MRSIIVMVILELIAILCIIFDVPYEPYGYIWLASSIIILVGVNLHEQTTNEKIK